MSNGWSTESLDFPDGQVKCFYNIPFVNIKDVVGEKRIVWVTDENVYKLYPDYFPGSSSIIIPAGDKTKNMETIEKAIEELLMMDADREIFIIGVGGGVVTDITGFLAAIYLRGVRFAFAPTSILAMVDASVGGKNGVNVDLYKNQIGTIRQPEYLFFDFNFLKTLPDIEWVSGFAEIAKHACIRDAKLFEYLKEHSLEDFRNDFTLTGDLVRRNVELKYKVASSDVTEKGNRRLLNFGHTTGHAIEKITGLPHGMAVSIGMKYGCRISEKLLGFPKEKSEEILELLKKYHLPVDKDFNRDKAWDVLLHDKKKAGDSLHYILLKDIGEATSKKLSLEELKQLYYEV